MPENTKKQIITPAVRTIFIIMAVLGLLLTLVPSILNWQGVTGPEQVNRLMLAGAIIWFVSASFLFFRKSEEPADI